MAYRLTADGETAFLGLLTAALWDIAERDPYLLPAGLCFVTMLTRKQAAEALEGREAAIALRVRALEARSRMLLEQRRVPPHTAELADLGHRAPDRRAGLGAGRPGSGSRTATTGSPASRGDGRTGRRAVVRTAGQTEPSGAPPPRAPRTAYTNG